MRSFIALGIFFMTPVFAQAEVPEKFAPVLEKGLAWLAKQQAADGSWSAPMNSYPTAITALAGMAFLAEGSTPSAGKYQETLRRAVDWLVDSCEISATFEGRFNRNHSTEAGRYMFGQGYAVLFLASAYPEEKDARRRSRMRDAINRGVRFIDRSQNKKGGWFYTSTLEGHQNDEGATTLANLQGLRAARLAGMPLPPNVLERGQAYLKTNTGSLGGVFYSSATKDERRALTAGAIACFDVEDLKDAVGKKWIDFYQRTPLPIRGEDAYYVFYSALAAYKLGEDAKPPAAGWTATRDKLFDHLSKSQLADGSWAGGSTGVGPVFATSLSVTVLQLDRETIAAFLR